MDIRPDSIQDLFNKLKDSPSLKDKMFLKDDKLTIVFGDHYKFDVVLVKGKGFLTYINDKYDFDFDDQDIVDILIDIVETNYYVVEKKHVTVPEGGNILFPNRKRFMLLSEKEFEKRKEKLLKTKDIKIFNHDKIIFDS